MAIRVGGLSVPALTDNPTAGRIRRAQWAGLGASVPVGLLLIPHSSLEAFQVLLLALGYLLVFHIMVWTPVFLAVPAWTPDSVDGRRWYRAHAVLLVADMMLAGITAVRLGAFFLSVPADRTSFTISLSILSLAFVLGAAFILRTSYRGHLRLGRYVWSAQDWNAARDAQAASPQDFPARFRDLVRFPEHALRVLEGATPEQRAALRPSDVLPLLGCSIAEVRTGVLTALAGLSMEYRRAA